MDHEYGSSALSENAVGWDWFSAQLDNGDVLMFAQIRTEDGGLVDEMQGTYLRQNGETSPLQSMTTDLRRWANGPARRPGRPIHPAGVCLPGAGHRARYSHRWWMTRRCGSASSTGKARLMSVAVSKAYLCTGTGFVELTGYGSGTRDQRFQR